MRNRSPVSRITLGVGGRVGVGWVLGCAFLVAGCGGASSKSFDEVPDTAGLLDSGAPAESGAESGGDEVATGDTGVVSDDTGGGGGDSAIADGDPTTDGSVDVDPTDSDDAGGADSSADSGATDSGADTGAADTEPADTGVVDTGPVDTGPTACTGAETCTVDSDGDGIPDSVEGFCDATPRDTDKDGIPDYLDDDSDGDGIPDKVEWRGGCDPLSAENDVDGDGVPNYLDLDSDGNGLVDKTEVCPPLGMPGRPVGCSGATPSDFDGDGVPDFLDFDNDHDSSNADKTVGLDDKFELVDATGKYVGLVDSDGDGIPDVYDRDSDNDFILDLDDGLADPDADGRPSFRDTDSDGDLVPDRCEARAKSAPTVADYNLPLLDSDGDGQPDYLDTDSDNDLISDKTEDLNRNCLVDVGETSRIKGDTDGDGVSDLIEVTLDTGKVGWATNPALTPAKAGKFYFVVPYSVAGTSAPSPSSSLLALSTKLNKGDVAFSVDTTGSMSGTIAGLKASLSTTIIPELKKRIADLGIAVTGHDDFPYSGFGSTGDKPFYLNASGFVTTDTATAQAQANALRLGNGNDGPESQVPAMYHILANSGLTWPGGSVPASTLVTGTFGAVRFRSDALPIVINATDISMHNGKRALSATTYDTSFQFPYSFTTYNVDQLVTKFNELGAKFIGLAADGGARATSTYAPYGHLAYIADKTGSVVPPSAFGGTTCKTGVSGGTVAADAAGGQCRLVFSFNSSGSGIGTSVVDGVLAMLNSIKFDVYVQAYTAAGESIDVVNAFMSKVEPQPVGGTDPVTGGTCVAFAAAQRQDWFSGPKALGVPAKPGPVDGAFDTIQGLNPGALYCYSVVPKPNTTIVAGPAAQLFRAFLRTQAIRPTGTFALGTDREVLFIVPPVAN